MSTEEGLKLVNTNLAAFIEKPENLIYINPKAIVDQLFEQTPRVASSADYSNVLAYFSKWSAGIPINLANPNISLKIRQILRQWAFFSILCKTVDKEIAGDSFFDPVYTEAASEAIDTIFAYLNVSQVKATTMLQLHQKSISALDKSITRDLRNRQTANFTFLVDKMLLRSALQQIDMTKKSNRAFSSNSFLFIVEILALEYENRAEKEMGRSRFYGASNEPNQINSDDEERKHDTPPVQAESPAYDSQRTLSISSSDTQQNTEDTMPSPTVSMTTLSSSSTIPLPALEKSPSASIPELTLPPIARSTAQPSASNLNRIPSRPQNNRSRLIPLDIIQRTKTTVQQKASNQLLMLVFAMMQ